MPIAKAYGKIFVAMNTDGMRYAPFGKRTIAFILDSLVLGLVMILMQFTIPYIAPLLVWVAYKTLFECSAIQATPGKRAMDLIVVGAHGERITMGTSLLRTLIAWLSVFTCFLIYFVALFTKRKQAVHDFVADTFVIEGRVAQDPGNAWVDEVQKVYEGFRGLFKNHGPRTYASEKEKLDLLEKLNTLRMQGGLSEEEYQARKRSILGG